MFRKFSRRQIVDIFLSMCFQKIWFDIFTEIISQRDDLHKISHPFSPEQLEKYFMMSSTKSSIFMLFTEETNKPKKKKKKKNTKKKNTKKQTKKHSNVNAKFVLSLQKTVPLK